MEASGVKTIYGVMPWAKHMLDYTDQVCEGLTDENMTLRPTDPSGGYFFSAAEQAMHIADSRWSFLGWIDGNDYSDREFAGDYPGKDKPWVFKPATCEEIKDSLKQSRARLDEILSGPSTGLLTAAPGTVKAHEEQLAKDKAAGKDTAEKEAQGPNNMVDIICFLNAHEQSHRGVLQTILRMNGVEVSRVA